MDYQKKNLKGIVENIKYKDSSVLVFIRFKQINSVLYDYTQFNCLLPYILFIHIAKSLSVTE